MLISKPDPEYPPLARQARFQGTVRFNVLIGVDGRVSNMTLISGHPLLAPAAQAAVREYVYQPTLLNGEPVQVVTQVDVNFTLAPAGAPGGSAAVGPLPPGVYRAGGGVQAPQVISRVDPEYSEEARAAKFGGAVVLSIVVDETGNPTGIEVVRGLGMGLDEKAIEAVRQWRFRPGSRNGKAVPVAAQVMVTFRHL